MNTKICTSIKQSKRRLNKMKKFMSESLKILLRVIITCLAVVFFTAMFKLSNSQQCPSCNVYVDNSDNYCYNCGRQMRVLNNLDYGSN